VQVAEAPITPQRIVELIGEAAQGPSTMSSA